MLKKQKKNWISIHFSYHCYYVSCNKKLLPRFVIEVVNFILFYFFGEIIKMWRYKKSSRRRRKIGWRVQTQRNTYIVQDIEMSIARNRALEWGGGRGALAVGWGRWGRK